MKHIPKTTVEVLQSVGIELSHDFLHDSSFRVHFVVLLFTCIETLNLIGHMGSLPQGTQSEKLLRGFNVLKVQTTEEVKCLICHISPDYPHIIRAESGPTLCKWSWILHKISSSRKIIS